MPGGNEGAGWEAMNYAHYWRIGRLVRFLTKHGDMDINEALEVVEGDPGAVEAVAMWLREELKTLKPTFPR